MACGVHTVRYGANETTKYDRDCSISVNFYFPEFSLRDESISDPLFYILVWLELKVAISI